MKRIIIFRFDRNPRICQNHLKYIQKLNPDVPIYGIYGGKEKDFSKYKKWLGGYFAGLYLARGRTDRFKWQNFDLVLRDWYRDVGRAIDFDTAYVIEWDLILTVSIERAYAHIKKGEVGLTALVPLRSIEKKWYWTTREPYATEWKKLLAWAKDTCQYRGKPNASFGPGLCVPKAFLERYGKIKIPELVHDELRVPLFAQIFGFASKDTGFHKVWFDKSEWKYFNCRGKKEWLIRPETIRAELRKPNGRRVFHPYRRYLDL